jgi:hypothetical protein
MKNLEKKALKPIKKFYKIKILHYTIWKNVFKKWNYKEKN